ncbi:hypothetical protein SUGI_0105510 [Cryptomeria japonica]|nr:hypothetical protein SUGI_0105510 [Cryptomeria japonica]
MDNTIPGLPQDLGLQCLVKVPYKFHNHLRAVCKSWNALLSTPIFYKERERHEECEEGIAYLYREERVQTDWKVIIYYPYGKWWEILPRTREELILYWNNFVYVRSKHHLVIMGLLNKYDNTPTVLMFDFISRTWRRGLDMPFRFFNFACAVSPSSPQGLIYITTFMCNNNGRIIADILQPYVFNVEENKWDFLPPINIGWLDRLCYEASVVAIAFDFANNSFVTVGQYPARIFQIHYAVLCRDYIFISAMGAVNYTDVYYRFNPLEREEEKRWTQIEMPAQFPGGRLFLATAVQI